MSAPDTRLSEAVKQAELAAEDMADDHPRYADAVEKLAWLLGECRRQTYGDNNER